MPCRRAPGSGHRQWQCRAQYARWAEMIGYTLAELSHCAPAPSKQLCHPEDQAMRRRHISAFGRPDAMFACELRLRHKLGHWVWVLDSGCIIARNVQGRPLIMIGACQDISARKQAQEALRQESERFMALAAVSRTPVCGNGMHLLHTCGAVLLHAGGAAAPDYAASIDQHGLPLEQVWLELLHPDDRERPTGTLPSTWPVAPRACTKASFVCGTPRAIGSGFGRAAMFCGMRMGEALRPGDGDTHQHHLFEGKGALAREPGAPGAARARAHGRADAAFGASGPGPARAAAKRKIGLL